MTTIHPEGFPGQFKDPDLPDQASDPAAPAPEDIRTEAAPDTAASPDTPINPPRTYPPAHNQNPADRFPLNRAPAEPTEEELLVASLRRDAPVVPVREQQGLTRRRMLKGLAALAGAALVGGAVVEVVHLAGDKKSAAAQQPNPNTSATTGEQSSSPSPEATVAPVDDYPSIPGEHAFPIQQGPLGVGTRKYPGNPGFRLPNGEQPKLNGKPIDLPVLYPPSLNYRGGGLDGDIIAYNGHAYRPDETVAMVLKYISAIMSMPLDSPDRKAIMNALTNEPNVALYLDNWQIAYEKLYSPGDTMVMYDSKDAPAAFGWLPNRYLVQDLTSPAKTIHMDNDGGKLYFRGLSPDWAAEKQDPWPDQQGYAAIIEESGLINPDPEADFFFEYVVLGNDGKPGAMYGTIRITEMRFLLTDRNGVRIS